MVARTRHHFPHPHCSPKREGAMANITPTFKPHESLWIDAANTLPPYERSMALIEIAELTRINLRQLTFYADGLLKVSGGIGSAWVSKDELAAAKGEVVGSLSQRIGSRAFQSAPYGSGKKRSQDAA